MKEKKKRAERENDIYIYIRSSRLVLGLLLAKHVSFSVVDG